MAEQDPRKQTGDEQAPADTSLRKAAEDMVAMVEAGAREPSNRFAAGTITFLCLAWSLFQMYLAYQPMDSHIARAWHLAFAVCLAFLAYPAYSHRYRDIYSFI